MDSLTQIVLGAACGEVVLGRKIGNKALLFGAIGGTIPDLDVILGNVFFNNSIDQLAFHRGFMHSILFTILAAFFFGFVVFKLYNTGKRYNSTELKNWIYLFFFAVFTHPVLDSFTPYGTQLFLPFSDTRVAFNTISVVDPLYTLPFLGCLLVVLFFKRTNPNRIKWAKAGLYISSFYMLFTLINKIYVDRVYKKSFEAAGIPVVRYRTQPTIFNNVLWYGIAETATDYRVGFYSILDSTSSVKHFLTLPKNHQLQDMQHPDLQKLTWFSDGYYNLLPIENSTMIRYNDLRYPLLNSNDPNSSIFSFGLQKKGDRYTTVPFYGTEPSKKSLTTFWERLKGI